MDRRSAVWALLAAALPVLAACGPDEGKGPPAPQPAALAAMTPEAVQALLGPMNRGLSALERYDYGDAAASFAKAVAVAPGFYPAHFDLAVSLVNNQKDPAAAERALRTAVGLAPKEAAPHYMLGVLLTQGVTPPRTEEAEGEFRAASALAPEDADCHHRLGLLRMEVGKGEEAEREFSAALEINPFLGAALYQRGLNRLRIQREKEGMEDLKRFQEMKRADRVDAREISYGFMGPLGNAVRDLDPWLPPGAPAEGATVRYVDVKGALDDDRDPGGTIAVADLDGDGLPDLVFGLGWRRNLGGWKFGPLVEYPIHRTARPTGDVVVADFDSDGRLDVVVDPGYLVMHAAESPEVRGLPGGLVSAGRFLASDLDADGDIDLVCGRTILLNDGKGNFTPSVAPVDLPPEPWKPLFLRDVDDDGFPDLVGETDWVRNLRGGSFGGLQPLPPALARAIQPLAEHIGLAYGDADADGIDDRAVAVGDGIVVERLAADGSIARVGPNNESWPLPESQKGEGRAAVFADFDGDGDLDLVVAQGGLLRFAADVGNGGKQTLHLRLAGVLHPNGRQFGWTNPRGIGARVEAFVGRRRVTRWMGLDLALDGKPAPDVAVFGLGYEAKADLLSIRWTEGVLQAESDVKVPPGPPATVVRIEEVQRKAASCPVVFAWDGEKFGFVADCMGGGGLGFLESYPGKFGKPDPTERVRIAAPQLRARDGFYDVRLLEPLEEVTYADRLSLTALDHPAGVEAYPDERFGGSLPPPGERVFVHPRAAEILPVRVVDARGTDVTDRLARTDRVYAGGFDLHRDLLGFTKEDHWIDLDFGDRVPAPKEGERLVLFLDGWIEYGYSRTVYAAAGAGVAPLSPTLEIPDGRGGWKTGIPDIGYPAGTPRTMTCDVTGVVGPACPRFRIRTNMEIYWDRAWLAVDRGESSLVRTTAAPAEARLRFAGFPREVSPDGREPKINDYRLMEPAMPGFRAMRGEYTRYGDVLPLVKDADDRYVVFRNGEEIALRFRASDFPPIREGWVRDFMLETTGWCKDMDYYTAEWETVGPLPFLGMSDYPPKAGEAYPADEAHSEWRGVFNTRIVR